MKEGERKDAGKRKQICYEIIFLIYIVCTVYTLCQSADMRQMSDAG